MVGSTLGLELDLVFNLCPEDRDSPDRLSTESRIQPAVLAGWDSGPRGRKWPTSLRLAWRPLALSQVLSIRFSSHNASASKAKGVLGFIFLYLVENCQVGCPLCSQSTDPPSRRHCRCGASKTSSKQKFGHVTETFCNCIPTSNCSKSLTW